MAIDSMVVADRPRFAIMHAFDEQLERPLMTVPELIEEAQRLEIPEEPSWMDAYTVGEQG